MMAASLYSRALLPRKLSEKMSEETSEEISVAKTDALGNRRS